MLEQRSKACYYVLPSRRGTWPCLLSATLLQRRPQWVNVLMCVGFEVLLGAGRDV